MRSSVVASLLVTSALALSDGGTAVAATKPTIAVSARSFKFTPSKIELDKGAAVTIALSSNDAFHDFVVTGNGVDDKMIVKTTGAGDTKRGTLRLTKPGTYQFFCSIPGHRAAGMRGTITVS
ncbi:MAG: plastocyanin/azurin family copper-binding protein [Acidimicrobiia bacterium]